MDRHELERLCAAAGMKRSSFNNRIAYSPVIEDRGGGRYALRGNGAGAGTRGVGTPRPGDAGHLRPPRRR